MTLRSSSAAADGIVADAVSGNWVDRLAPRATRPYLRLSRADRPIGTWLLYIPCLWGIALAATQDGLGWWDLWLAISCGIGAFLMRGAGCTWNDITDQDFDAKVTRTKSRPLPSGQVSTKGAVAWMGLQALISCAILLSYNLNAILLGVLSLLPVLVYPFAKRFTWWPQVFLGLAFNWGALMGWTAHTGSLGWPAVMLYVAGISWTLYYDTIYAHQDREDDALIGVKSTARLFGDRGREWLWFFLCLTLVLLAVACLMALIPLGSPVKLVLAFAGIACFGWHMAAQMRRLNVDDTESCLREFRANRDAGLIFALFIAGAALL